MSDEQPDLQAVAADEAALDGLRASAGGDPALALLRELLLDVERDLPARLPLGSTVLTLVGEDAPDRRLARGGTVVAALTAGLLSLGGVAAASTLAPTGSPLHGFGEAVRSAAGAVVGAVTPPTSSDRSAVAVAGPSASPSPSASALAGRAATAPRPPTPGPTVAALARSEAAARQVDHLLDEATALQEAGRTSAATSRLDRAERRLAEVLPVHRGDLAQRLADLRARTTTASPAARPERSPKAEPAESKKAEHRGSARTAPPKPKAKQEPAPRSKGVGGKALVDQLSDRDASMKPRA